jgi:hypothetical protein
MKLLLVFLLLGLAGCVREPVAGRIGEPAPVRTAVSAPPPDSRVVPAMEPEQVRTGCIEGRRLICGKVLKILPDGLVVDSGYTDLVRPPLTQSWVMPGTVSASRNPAGLELKEPGTPCLGLCFLTDIPKRPKVKVFDYVVIMGYPAGSFRYAAVPNVERNIRKFSAGLDTAVKLSLQGAFRRSQSDAGN